MIGSLLRQGSNYAVVVGSASEGAGDELAESENVGAPTMTLLPPIIHQDIDVGRGVLGDSPVVSSDDSVMLLDQLSCADQIRVALELAAARNQNKV